MSDGEQRSAEAAFDTLRRALAEARGPDETIDSEALGDLIAGRLDADAEAELLGRLGVERGQLVGLRRSVASAGGVPGVIDPLGTTAPPVYLLDGPHGGREGTDDPVFGPGDRVELLARPSGPVPHPPPLSVWVGRRDGPLAPVTDAKIERDISGVYRVLMPAARVFDAPGRWRLMLVLGDEAMAPSRAVMTDSMVQVLRAWAVYDDGGMA